MKVNSVVHFKEFGHTGDNIKGVVIEIIEDSVLEDTLTVQQFGSDNDEKVWLVGKSFCQEL